MNIHRLKGAIETCRERNLPVFIWGGPGIGKSQAVRQICEDKKIRFIDVRLSLLNPVDLRGLPMAVNGVAEWLPPAFLPKDEKPTILFFDELNLAVPAVQTACYQLILDRKIGEYNLPKNTYILAAGNRQEDKANIFDMPAPLKNRFLHLAADVDFDVWKDWAYKNSIHHSIISFLNFKTDYLYKDYDPAKFKRGFPTPRSWEMVSRIISELPEDQIHTQTDLIEGCVGEGCASTLCGFLKIYTELPAVDKIIDGKWKKSMPTEAHITCALIGSLIDKFYGSLDKNTKADNKKRMNNMLSYLHENLEKKGIEFFTVFIKDFIKHPKSAEINTELTENEVFGQFVAKHGNITSSY